MKIRNIILALSILATSCVSFNSCKEDIDESDLYTFTGEMMIDHFVNHPDTFSSYLQILQKVHPSKRSSSTMRELLSARGHYTCFAPTNEAIDLYLDSLYQIGQITAPDLSAITDSVAEAIVFNSLIDTGDDGIAYASTEFDSIMPTNNMNDRPITMRFDNNEATGIPEVFVNIHSHIIEKDIEVENGYIHVIDHVISPSNATVSDMVSATENTQFFGDLLELTGWGDKLHDFRDFTFDDWDLAGTTYADANGDFSGKYPEHRDTKYTIFVETDDVYERAGITDVESLKKYIREHAYYNDDASKLFGEEISWGDDYENENNAVNQFVAYHIVKCGLTPINMVTWSNERGYYNGELNKNRRHNVNVWEYWETIGKHRRMIKITGTKNGKRINRQSIYKSDTYQETSAPIEGILVHDNNGTYTNESLNGWYFPIDDILIWNEDVPNKVLNERIRIDICSMLPELINAGCRLNRTNSWRFPYNYFENIPSMSEQTEFNYLPNKGGAGGATASGGSWMNYQSDEFNIRGIYDFVLKLPPVPYTGTYEIRYGINANNNRGMAQIYLGTNPKNLPAIGIPLDLRITGDNNIVGPWKSDTALGSSDAIDEFDKQMRNNGFMKGPKYFYPGSGQSGRDGRDCLRRVIFTGDLRAGQTYYIRFKSVLDDTNTQFFFDYLEFVPKIIYNGPIAEDKW